jgi:hypothetical protein
MPFKNLQQQDAGSKTFPNFRIKGLYFINTHVIVKEEWFRCKATGLARSIRGQLFFDEVRYRCWYRIC